MISNQIDTYPMVVITIFVVACAVSSVIVVFLPETTKQPQVQTIEDAKLLGE